MTQPALAMPVPAPHTSLTPVAKLLGVKDVIRAAAVQRPVSTLNPDARFALTAPEKRQGFFYLYYGQTKARRSWWTWLSMAAAAIFPDRPQKEITIGEEKKFKAIVSEYGKLWTSRGASRLTRVKRNEEAGNFTIEVPLMVFDNSLSNVSTTARGAMLIYGMCIQENLDPLTTNPSERTAFLNEQLAKLTTGEWHDLANVQVPSGKPAVTARDLKAAQDAKGQIRVERRGDMDTLWLRLTIEKRQVEYLVNTPWIAVRPIDVYGPIFEWVDSQYGRFGKAPAFSLPLKKIAATLQGHAVTPRLSEDGVMVDEHGDLFWLPTELVDINRFEDAMTAAYQQPGGTFSAIPEDGKPSTPPPSMPVMVDWINLKFSYTTLEGRLNIKNLDRTYVANETHFLRFLERKLGSDLAANFISLVQRMGLFYGSPTANTFTAKEAMPRIAKVGARREAYKGAEEIPLYELQNFAQPFQHEGSPEPEPGDEFCRAFVELAEEVLRKIEASPETAYARYSVLTVMTLRAQLIAFTRRGKNIASLKAFDKQRRNPYVNQGEDPNFALQPVPYVQDMLGMMPHQVKVANVTRERPDHVFYPIDAGGGKTIVCIYDLLREIANGETGPFVVMCPSHLVPQYVKELVYATNGRMNCIPITTYTIRRQGFDRLHAMITSAPVNFCIVVDYDVIDLGSRNLSYGVAPVKVFPVIEFIRQFSPKYVFCDEAHYLRNESTRQSATNRLIADIPKKRMASGTLVANTILDLARQMALMDPTVFGTTDDFIREFALEVRGSKVMQWKPGAELEVRRIMRENSILAEARRKEWAAILPYPKERFHRADLTPKQTEVYKQIMNAAIEELNKKMEENEALRSLFMPRAEGESEGDDAPNIDKLLKPFLARLERFLTAPSKDPLGKMLLSGEDELSPKAAKVVDICREHIQENIPGKVLIFTSYEFSAQAVYEALQADPLLKDMVIYYTADRKEECGAEFEHNPDKKILVGIEFSMNTGLNLQHASRLIRLESVWTPGVLEQGNSRIGRPNLKDKESRPYVYYDWIIANRTVDVTKAAYLMAKTISKSKFDEAGNPRFDDLNVPALLTMTLDTISETNDFSESLKPYFDDYAAYKQALFAEYDEYREKNKDKLFTPSGELKLTKVERSANPPGSKLMLRVPYVPGMEVYSGDKLGLVRYDAFMRLNLNEEDESESNESEGDDNDTEDDANVDPQLQAERNAALGMAVHTDRGDGTIVRVNKVTLQVELPSGERIKVRKMASFIITRANTSNTDVRTQLLKMTGDVPIDAPVEVLETKLTERKKRQLEREEKRKQKEREEDPIPALQLELTVVNDYLGLRVANFADDERISSILQAHGFKYSPAYYAAEIPTAPHLLKLAQKWADMGFSVDKENSLWLKTVYMHMKQSRKNVVNFFGVASQSEITNFYRTEFKPNPDDMHINPFPLIQDGVLYVALPARGQPGSRKAINQARVPGVKWFEYESNSELIAFTPSKARASAVIQKLLSLGLEIQGLEKLKKQFSKLRIARDTE